MWSAIPVALLCMVVNQNGGSSAAAPKGTKSCRTQGTSVRLSVRPSPQALSALKSALFGPKSTLSGVETARKDLRPKRNYFRPERADSRSKRADFRPERADFRAERAWGGRMNG